MTVLDLPDAVTAGRDMAESWANIHEASELVLDSDHEQARRPMSSQPVRETMMSDVALV